VTGAVGRSVELGRDETERGALVIGAGHAEVRAHVPLLRNRPGGAAEIHEACEAEGSINDLPEPIEPVPEMPLPSEILARMRSEES
jgi:hypothetical protein